MIENFIYDIVVEVNSVTFTTKELDIDVQIQDSEDDPRNCNINIYNLNLDKHRDVFTRNSKISVAIIYNTIKKTEVFFNGVIKWSFDNREGDDVVLSIYADDGYVEALNSPVSVKTASSSTMLSVVKDMTKNSKVTLKEYPPSLDQVHVAKKSQFIVGDLDTELNKFLGKKYISVYKNNELYIYERYSSLDYNLVVGSNMLYETPRKQMSYESTEKKDTILKEYDVVLFPVSNISRGKSIKITGSKYIDEIFFSINACSFSFSKTRISCQLKLVEKQG